MALAAPSHILRRPWLVIDAQHGLGNRLRTIASAASIAQQSDRELLVLWQPDHHCEGHLHDLIDYDGAVITDDPGETLRERADLTYSYMEIEEDSAFNAPILPDPAAAVGQNVYIKAAYTLVSPLRSHDAEQAFLHALRPVQAVRDLVESVRHPNQVAAHIRMAGGAQYDHLSFEAAAGNWPEHRHQELTEWRAKSHIDRFLPRIEALIAEGQCETLFLAADVPETYARFAAEFGDRVAWLERQDFDRSARQLQYALADILLLTAAERLLASSWSSFSDLAQRLGRSGRPVEQSGQDF